MPISVELIGKYQLEPGQGCSSVVTLFYAKKSVAETDRRAGALS
jgi:hypothetical protein